MKSIASFIIIGALIIIAVGGLFMATWKIPVPTTKIEKNISIPTATLQRKIFE